jgi:quercetin dioxygenase-like cupin family protein
MLAMPSEEIRIGGMAIRFRLESEASGGSVALFEFDVASGARVPGAHSHDAYEETIYGLEGVLSWTLDGVKTDVGRGRCCASVAGSSTASTTTTSSTRRCSRS